LSGKPGILALTPGDPSGIGPEIVAKSLARWKIGDVRLALYGPDEVWSGVLAEAELKLQSLEIISLPYPRQTRPKKPSPSAWGGIVAMEALEAAVSDAIIGKVMAVVTGPVSKGSMSLAGWNFPGQTELLAKLTEADEWAMMLANGKHRVVLATRHIRLGQVVENLNTDRLIALFVFVDRELRAILKKKPRILVCGVNPHAGDAGLLGDEEKKIIEPAVRAANCRGVDIVGPVSAEEAYSRWGEAADVVVAMYHDQGAVPVKLLGLHSAVNVTLGLPIVRTSPGHGTAFSLAGTGRADERSFLNAMRWAVALAR